MTSQAEQFLRDGYTLLPGLYDAATVQALRDALTDLHAEVGHLPLYAREPIRDTPHTEISSTGLVFFHLLGWRPGLAPLLMHPTALQVVRDILGLQPRIELVGAVMTDHTRPFFEWHNHVGGPDDEDIRVSGEVRPTSMRPQRLSYLIYLDEATIDDGPLLVLPGRPTDTRHAPEPRDRIRWQGDVAVTWPAGSVLLIDETTWHAVPQRTHPGLRRWVGAYFAAADVPHSQRLDESLRQVTDPVLRELIHEPKR
jgi:hypothetical protein